MMDMKKSCLDATGSSFSWNLLFGKKIWQHNNATPSSHAELRAISVPMIHSFFLNAAKLKVGILFSPLFRIGQRPDTHCSSQIYINAMKSFSRKGSTQSF